MSKFKKLTPKQETFVSEYLVDLNATQAAIRAGYSAKTAYSIGEENLRKPEIRRAISLQMDNRTQRLTLDSDAVLKRLIEVDQMDLLDILNNDLSIKPLSEWTGAWRTTISSIEIVEQLAGASGEREIIAFIKKIKLPDKQKNLEMLGRHIDIQAWRNRTTPEVKLNMSLDELMKEAADDRNRECLPSR